MLRLMLRYLADMLEAQNATYDNVGALPDEDAAFGGDVVENVSQVTEMS